MASWLSALLGIGGSYLSGAASRKAYHAQLDYLKEFSAPELAAKKALYPWLVGDIRNRLGRGSTLIRAAYDKSAEAVQRAALREGNTAEARWARRGNVGQAYGAQWRARRAAAEGQGELALQAASAEEQYQTGLRGEARSLIQPAYGMAQQIAGLQGAGFNQQASLWEDAGLFAADLLGKAQASSGRVSGGAGGEAPAVTTTRPTETSSMFPPTTAPLPEPGVTAEELLPYSDLRQQRKRWDDPVSRYSRPRLPRASAAPSVAGGLW